MARRRLAGLRVLVTGASQGIGRALAVAAAKRGCKVLAAARSADLLTELANEGFYDGVVFHRVIDGFMAQGGDPTGTGGGGSDKPDLQAEFNAEPHVRGTCSMARTNYPHSANSQFFICFDDARFLDKNYTVWGKVTEGMENVDKIKRGEPVQNPDKIIKARVA